MERRMLTYILAAIIGLIVTACGDKPDARLLRAEALMSDSLPQARSLLDSIDSSTLSESDRHLHALLTIKGRDKADMKISEKSIRNVADYYSQHGDSSRYAEALYYRGRMFCQQGDYPDALVAFRAALEIIPENYKNKYLKGLILSQAGRRMNQMRIYNEADSFLRESIEIDSVLKDTLGLMYDIELLGAINIHSGNLERAESLFKKTLKLAESHSAELAARQKMYLAGVLYERGNFKEALDSIRGIPEKITGSYAATALGYAADIYLANRIVDTAYIYAVMLEKMENANNRKAAYRILLSPELRKIVPSDSIEAYASRYTYVAEDFISRNGNLSSVIQNVHYNFKHHAKARKKAEATTHTTKIILIIALTFLIGIIIITSLLFFKNKRIRRNHADISKKMDILRLSFFNPGKTVGENGEIIDPKELKAQLLRELLDDCKNGDRCLPEQLLHSDIYLRIRNMCKNEKNISDASTLWIDLEKKINEVDVDFSYRVNLLLGNKATDIMRQHVFLIKCGFNSKEIAILVAKTPAAISHRRKLLAKAIFNDLRKVDTLDLIIRRL